MHITLQITLIYENITNIVYNVRKNKHLKSKKRALNNYSRWKRIHRGSSVKKKFFKTKASTTLKVGRAGPLAPSTISVFNNGEV